MKIENKIVFIYLARDTIGTCFAVEEIAVHEEFEEDEPPATIHPLICKQPFEVHGGHILMTSSNGKFYVMDLQDASFLDKITVRGVDGRKDLFVQTFMEHDEGREAGSHPG